MSMLQAAVAKQAVEAICAHYGFTLSQIQEHKKNADRTSTKRAVALLLREQAGWSWPRIGRYLVRDHTTIIFNVEQARKSDEVVAVVAGITAAMKASGGAKLCPTCKKPIKKN